MILYCYLTYEEYKTFERQLREVKEQTHWTDEGYHKSFRLKLGDLVLEVHGPLVRVKK